MNRDFPLATQNKTTTSEFLLRKLHEKDDKSTINSSGRDRMVVLDQHIKFLEGNYSVTITVSWERQTWGHYGAVNGEGRRGESQSNLAILNILRHIIMVWFGEKNGQEWHWLSYACMRVCVWMCVCECVYVWDDCPTSCVSDYYTTIISGPSLSLSLSLSLPIPPPSISPVPSLRVQHRTKHTVMQRECEAQQSGSSSHHNYIQLLPFCLFPAPLSSPPTLFSLKHLCFSTLSIMCPCRPLCTHLRRTQFVSLL